MQRLNITSAFRRTVSGHGTGTLSSVQSPLSTVCTWRCSKWSSAVFSLFMTPLIRSKSYQSVRIIWSSLSNRIYTYPPTHTHIYTYMFYHIKGLGGNHRFLPLFSHILTFLLLPNSFREARDLGRNYSNHLLQGIRFR